ncbi:MAG: 2-C-methyl-D-erythritol 4-phosphate cytidylyltransferase [Eubacteriales bacterium]|nr:2-C-methyl-D-erythritol 4-phosphate cytidylyltransferase [Eubacteriales bacterium]
MKVKTVAVVLAAGRGSRMNSEIQKQYLLLLGRPVVTHTLDTFEASDIDEIVLVVGEDEIPYARKEIVERYGYKKINKIVVGGEERYDSVYQGLCAISDTEEETYVLIHDGARAFVTVELINFCIQEVKKSKACVAAVPVKDTIKVVDEEGYAESTPDRSVMWQMQTPQCFYLEEIKDAYRLMTENHDKSMTDDAMVMEKYGNRRVKMVRGSYENIKITTPTDMFLGEAILKYAKK